MSLKYREANPLAVYGLRWVDHCPPHFTTVKFDGYVDDKVITDWVWENLEGRFHYGFVYSEDADSKKINSTKVIGFELAGEASYFALMMSTFNKSSFDM